MKVYTDVEEAWQVMLSDIEKAKKSIWLEQYLIADMKEGEIGNSLIKLLIEKARQGVRVRLLADAIGSHELILSPFWNDLKSVGAELKIFGLVPRWRFKVQPPFLNRNHRKLLIIDDKKVHVGGVVFTESVRGWLDYMVCFERYAENFKESFDVMWNHSKEEQNNSVFKCGEISIANIIPHHDLYYRSLLKRIRSARAKVWIFSPYFSPDLRIRRALYGAAKRGVDVRVILPEKTDNVFADMASRSFVGTLLRKRVKVLLIKNKISHAKVVAIDDWITFGSMNFDRLSFFYNYELNVESEEPSTVSSLSVSAEDFLNIAQPVSKKEWRRVGFVEKLRRHAGFFMRPFV